MLIGCCASRAAAVSRSITHALLNCAAAAAAAAAQLLPSPQILKHPLYLMLSAPRKYQSLPTQLAPLALPAPLLLPKLQAKPPSLLMQPRLAGQQPPAPQAPRLLQFAQQQQQQQPRQPQASPPQQQQQQQR
jgi:hypothetical protein